MSWYNSLIFKIILCSVLLTLCLILSIFSVLYQYQQSILAEMERKSSEIVEEMEINLTSLKIDHLSGEIFKSEISDLKDRHGVDGVTLYDSEKNMVTSLESAAPPLLEFGSPQHFQTKLPGRHGNIATRYTEIFPLMVGGQPVGYVDIRLSVTPQTHLVKALQSDVLIALLILFMTTLSALCYFIVKLLRPLHSMATTCQEICEGNLHEIDIMPNASEVLMLEMKFNEMVRALKSKARVEQKLVQAERLAALGNLAAGVAHEIGNPLNGIKLTMSHMKDISSRGELERDSFGSYADSILEEVARLDRIVRDFLTLAKERELALQPFVLGRLVEETVCLIEKDAEQRGIKIETKIAPDAGTLMLDPQLLKGAIINVLINAMEASEADGTINVEVGETNGMSVVTVMDSGHGIAPEILEHVFDPYFSTKSTGTGLGLPLTRTIIEKHNGEISVESGPGSGSKVTITLPAGGKEQ